MSRSRKPRPRRTTPAREKLQRETDEKVEVTNMQHTPPSTTLVIDGKPFVIEHRQVRYDPTKRKFLIATTPVAVKS